VGGGKGKQGRRNWAILRKIYGAGWKEDCENIAIHEKKASITGRGLQDTVKNNIPYSADCLVVMEVELSVENCARFRDAVN